MQGDLSRPRKPSATGRTRARRTQEQRSAATRAKIVEAATQCVAELGFRGATMGAMAECAGVSFGAIQHQFGEKDALFDAVLEHVLAQLQTSLAGLRDEVPEPAARVRAFVRRSRKMLRGPVYRAFVEIQLNRGRERDATSGAWSRHVGGVLSKVWGDVFGDLGLSHRRLQDAQRFTFAVLSGIAAETLLFPDTDFEARHFQILEDTLLRLLGVEP